MHEALSDSESERAAVAARGAAPGDGIRRCPVCGMALRPGQTSACSGKCRAAKSRQSRQDAVVTLEAQLERLLEGVRVLAKPRSR